MKRNPYAGFGPTEPQPVLKRGKILRCNFAYYGRKIINLVGQNLARFALSSAQQILDFAATQTSNQQSKGWQSLSALSVAPQGWGRRKVRRKSFVFTLVLFVPGRRISSLK